MLPVDCAPSDRSTYLPDDTNTLRTGSVVSFFWVLVEVAEVWGGALESLSLSLEVGSTFLTSLTSHSKT